MPDGAVTQRNGGFGERSPAEKVDVVVQFEGGRLADQLQDEGHGATKDQRTGANEVLVGLIDVLNILLSGKVRKGAQEGEKASQGVGHSPKIGSRLIP